MPSTAGSNNLNFVFGYIRSKAELDAERKYCSRCRSHNLWYLSGSGIYAASHSALVSAACSPSISGR